MIEDIIDLDCALHGNQRMATTGWSEPLVMHTPETQWSNLTKHLLCLLFIPILITYYYLSVWLPVGSSINGGVVCGHHNNKYLYVVSLISVNDDFSLLWICITIVTKEYDFILHYKQTQLANQVLNMVKKHPHF